jgi:hypothetical protein
VAHLLLSPVRGLLGQVEGRTADDVAYWLAQQPAAWRHAVQVVAIDMGSIYASAVRRMLPKAMLVVDLFHVVQLAVKMTGDVRRRVPRAKYGRRGRSGDPEYSVKRLLGGNVEHLSGAQFAKIIETLAQDRRGPPSPPPDIAPGDPQLARLATAVQALPPHHQLLIALRFRVSLRAEK